MTLNLLLSVDLLNLKSLKENITYFAQVNHQSKLGVRLLPKLCVEFSRLCIMYCFIHYV